MSNQIQSVTLQTAILMQVQEFAKANIPFSVHNITQEVRAKVNNGTLEIPEVEVTGASFRFDIPHTKVKSLFEELWRTGVFDPDFSLNRQFNGKYFEYTPTLTNSGLQTASSVPPSNYTSLVTAPQPSVTTTTVAPATPVTDSSVRSRIQTYLDNCENRNFRPTLKQVQSAIKRDVSTGWSCEKIQDYIEGLGYSVVADPDSVSASQVVF